MKSLFVPIALLALSATVFLFSCARSGRTTEERAPRIVNLINFVRNTEPRPVNISDEELYRTTLAQTELLRRHGLKGTFLLQYDALINPKYQALMKQGSRRGLRSGRLVGNHPAPCRSGRNGVAGSLPVGLACQCRLFVGLRAAGAREARRYVHGQVQGGFRPLSGLGGLVVHRCPHAAIHGRPVRHRRLVQLSGPGGNRRIHAFGEDTGTKDTIRAN